MSKIKFPKKVLQPLWQYLKREEKKLEKRKEELKKQDPFSDFSRINDNAASDADAAEQSGHARIAALIQQIDKTLINIKKTLTKIKIGRYGICERCGKMIDTDRLAINPTARFCVECEKKRQEG
jgi:RNA polymerase-binding transcription factor DksA